jgi:hypothetical protein
VDAAYRRSAQDLWIGPARASMARSTASDARRGASHGRVMNPVKGGWWRSLPTPPRPLEPLFA